MQTEVTEIFQRVKEFFTHLEPEQAVGLAVVGLTAVYLMATKMFQKKGVESSIDPNNQSVVIDEATAHRASWKGNAPNHFGLDRLFPECKSVYGSLLIGKEKSNNGPCFGSRTGPNKEYEWLTYQEVMDQVQQFGSALVFHGLRPENDTFVGIFASNSVEWSVADFGCQAFSICPVPLYDILGEQAIKYILNQCEISLLLVDTNERLKTILSVKPDIQSLTTVVTTEDWTPDLEQLANERGVQLIRFRDFMEMGKNNLKEVQPGKQEDLFSLCYTSGTTGNPKGVMLTHESFLKMVEGIIVHLQPHMPTTEDVHLSYLPQAHNFGRGTMVLMMLSGGRVGFYSRDITLLMDDLAALRPTVFPSVPRLLNRVYDAVHNEVKDSALKSFMLRTATSSKLKQVKKGVYRRNTLWDKLIFHKLQAKLGGRVRLVISGSAPLSPDVINFLRAALGCVVMEGYGQTEVGAGITFSLPEDTSAGSVGPPLPGVHVKLVDVPDMGFFVKDNVGEVCTKTEFQLCGYYKQPHVYAETVDDDGWLHTGDIGKWTPSGTLMIIDRKKHLFKLAQGEYISPEKVEVAYSKSAFVAQCFVDGNSMKPCIMGVVVPDALYLAKWAPSNNMPTDVHEFCKHKNAKKIVLEDIRSEGKKAGLLTLEQVKDIILEPELFSVENGLITPTMKSMRPALRRRYKVQIDTLYSQLKL